MLCRICGQKTVQIDTVTCVKGHAHLGTAPFALPVVDVPLYRCPNCGHAQTPYLLDDAYYDDYDCRETENSLTYYTYTDSIYSQRLEKLQGLNNGKSILDIGCGAGDALLAAQEYYERCVGVEPSLRECQAARKRGLCVINSYFDSTVQFEQPFDAAMCNMVFEHLESPATVLKKAHDVLPPPMA